VCAAALPAAVAEPPLLVLLPGHLALECTP
jgi:hypothetical protein